jgi:hypothetical protein
MPHSRKRVPWWDVQNVNSLFEFCMNPKHEYDVTPSDDMNIRRWYEEFKETGNLEKGWPGRSDEGVDCVW